MINAGNPSVANLKMRKYVKEHKQSSSQIFEKLNRRGRLNPAQNAMSAQLTNEQLLRFYVKETVPKLQYNNDDIQGQGGDTNSVLMNEIQRLIDVGNFNAQDAKGNMTAMQNSLIGNANNIQNNLIAELQRGFTSVNDSIADNLSFVKVAIDDIADNLAIYASTNDTSSQNIITSLNDLNTKLEEYNTTGTTSQSALFASLTNLQTALANSNTNNAANTAAIDNLSIIMGSMSGTPGVGVGTAPATPATPTAPAAPVVPASPAAPAAPASPVAPASASAPASPAAPASAPPVLPPVPSGLIPLLPPPPSPGAAAIAAQAAADALAAGSPIMTTSTTTGMQTLVTPTPNIAPLAGAKGGADPNTVMVAGPKVPVGVGSYPEYDAIKAKNGGKDLTMKDYREILNKVGTDLPQLFSDELQKSGNKKISTYINQLSKAEIVLLSEKILKEKYQFKDATTKLQEVSLQSLSSRNYGRQISSATLIQNALRGRDARAELRQVKYQALANAAASIQQQKEISSATRVQTKFRSHLARQDFARQKLIGVPFLAQPELYSLVRGTGPLTLSNLYDPSVPFSQEEFDAFFAP